MYNVPSKKTKLTLLHLIQYLISKENRISTLNIEKKELIRIGGYKQNFALLNKHLQKLMDDGRITITVNKNRTYNIKVINKLTYSERKTLGVKAIDMSHSKDFYYLLILYVLEKRENNGIIEFKRDKVDYMNKYQLLTPYFKTEKDLIKEKRLIPIDLKKSNQKYKLSRHLSIDELNKLKDMLENDEYYHYIYDEINNSLNVLNTANVAQDSNLEEQVQFILTDASKKMDITNNESANNKIDNSLNNSLDNSDIIDETIISDIDNIIDKIKNRLINVSSKELIAKNNKLIKENEQLRKELALANSSNERYKNSLLQIYNNLSEGEKQWEE